MVSQKRWMETSGHGRQGQIKETQEQTKLLEESILLIFLLLLFLVFLVGLSAAR
jgi:hypothetical protein